MALECVFGATNKKHNSTFTGLHDIATSIVLKENCSVTNPSVFVALTAAEIFNVHGETLNHAYIPQFKRFYFVDNWTWERGRWRADLSVDVLATWKDEIGVSTQYILRAANDYDGNIFDKMYPTKNVISESTKYSTVPWTLADGYYIIGIVSGATSFGAVTYYGFTAGDFTTFCNYMFGTDYINVEQITQDISIETWKSLYNPFQYVVSCTFIPLDISNKLSTRAVKVGHWNLPGITAGKLISITPASVSVWLEWAGAHPKEARGSYVYCGPYTEVDLDIQPFGHVSLPSDIIRKRGGIQCDIDVDVLTGQGTCFVGGYGAPIMTMKAQVGVPIRLAQMATDYLGTATTAVSGVAGVVSNVLSGDIAGAIGAGASAIDSTVRAQVPRLSTTGGGGGFSALVTDPRAIYRYYDLVNEDNAHLGRPLCARRRIDTLGDYILCEGAAVNTTGTFEENRMISNLMNTGFYFE